MAIAENLSISCPGPGLDSLCPSLSMPQVSVRKDPGMFISTVALLHPQMYVTSK